MHLFGFYIKFNWPVIVMPLWKHNAIIAAKAGKMLEAVKAIRDGLNLTYPQAREIYEKKYVQMYRKP